MFSYLRNTFGRTPSVSDPGASRQAAAIALLAEPTRTPEQERSVERLEARLFFDESLLAAAGRVRPTARGSIVLGLIVGLIAATSAPGTASATELEQGASEIAHVDQGAESEPGLLDQLLEWLREEVNLLGDEEDPDYRGDN